MARLQQARGLLLHSWPHQHILLAGYLWLNEAPIQVQCHKVLHGIGDLISPQTPQNQQLLEGIKLSFPFPRQGLSAKQLGAFYRDVPDPAAPQEAPKLPAGSHWSFRRDKDFPVTWLRLSSLALKPSAGMPELLPLGKCHLLLHLRHHVALPWASNTHRQGPPSRRQGDALRGMALTVSRASTVAVSAPCALPGMPLPAGCSTAKLRKQGALACEAWGCQKWP